MNPVTELSLAIKHLNNYFGSSVCSGLERDIVGCALGALKHTRFMYDKPDSVLTEEVDIHPVLFATLDELQVGF